MIEFSAKDAPKGFQFLKQTPLPHLGSVAYELIHAGSGARILHIHNDDSENLFSVTFPTPPPDDTGVPHILEHSVLAGSRRYRVKDPFFEMIKGSMATFINAMTGTDYTVYPVASNVRQDFYNLAEVYWDAVFHPLLTEATFQREGHHLELAKKGDLSSDLIIKGIVYNEMKGARSSPEAKVYDVIEKNLWPDTPCGKDSGGDPEFIPDLTWQQLRDFHQKYYHPSNAYIFLYGDIPTAEHLEFLGTRLAEFSRKEILALVPPQPRWTQPRRRDEIYAIGPNEPTAAKTFIVMNWLIGSTQDVPLAFAFNALDRILLGNQAAPLRKAIIDSKLGEDLSHNGFWSNGVDTSYHIGLRGSEGDREDAFRKLVMDTLQSIADTGITQRQFDSAIQQLSYKFLEVSPTYPLQLMGWAVGLWRQGGDAMEMFRAQEHIRQLKKNFAEDPKFFSKIIRDRLLDNPHRLMIVARPDVDIQAKNDAQLTDKLRRRKAAMSTAELQKLVKDQEEMEALLNAPNSPEAIASLPQLRVIDLPRKPRHIPTTVEKLDGGAVLLNSDIPANGVNYLHLSFDLTGLPAELYPYLPLYSDCVDKMGAAGQDFVSIAQRIAESTGGIKFSATLSTAANDPKNLVRHGTFSTKFLDENAQPALSLLKDLIFGTDPSDGNRLRDVLMQARAHQRTRPSHDGMGLAMRHAARGLNLQACLEEMIGGLPQIHLFEQIATGQLEPLMQRILAIRKFLLNRKRVTASFTGTPKVLEIIRKQIAAWTSEMSDAPLADSPVGFSPWKIFPREGLAAPMNVAYCTMVMPAPHATHPDSPILSVGGRLLSLGYVLEEVRFKGTAYGGGCGYSPAGQAWTFHSYRDPWINRTLDVYRGALDFIRKADWTQGDVDRSIIGTAKEGEKPIRAPQASGNALWRYLTGTTNELREARHTAMLGATLANIRQALISQFENYAAQSSICVVSSRQKLEQANGKPSAIKLEIQDIPCG